MRATAPNDSLIIIMATAQSLYALLMPLNNIHVNTKDQHALVFINLFAKLARILIMRVYLCRVSLYMLGFGVVLRR